MYKTVLREGRSRLEEKKSEFLGYVSHVRSKEEAEAVIAHMRKAYPDARHHCSAYIMGAGGIVQKYDDDGEPQKTAGPPILEVLKRNGLENVVCVVTRYFGGTLLGAGGLIRAYSTAASLAVEEAVVVEMHAALDLRIRYDYTFHGALENFLMQYGYPVFDAEFTDQVALSTTLLAENEDALLEKLTDLTAGDVYIVEKKATERPVRDGFLLYNKQKYKQTTD